MYAIRSYYGRQKPLYAGAIWLDELIAFLAITVMSAFLAIWAYWGLYDHTALWIDFESPKVLVVGIIGAIAGTALYVWEGRNNFV